MLFCYAFTTPFLNKVFLELYAIDCTFYATTSSVYQITISFSKVKQNSSSVYLICDNCKTHTLWSFERRKYFLSKL